MNPLQRVIAARFRRAISIANSSLEILQTFNASGMLYVGAFTYDGRRFYLGAFRN